MINEFLHKTYKGIAIFYDILCELLASYLVEIFLDKSFLLYRSYCYEIVMTDVFVLESSLDKLKVSVEVEVERWSDLIAFIYFDHFIFVETIFKSFIVGECVEHLEK